MTLLPIQSRDTQIAESFRKEALRRLKQAEDDGIGVRAPQYVNTDAVYSPFEAGLSFFTLEDFNLTSGTPGSPFPTDPHF